MGLDNDVDRAIKDAEKERQRQHERVMRKTLLKKTRIEQKAAVKQAKVRNVEYLVLQGFIAAFLLCAVIAVCVTYYSLNARPPTPEEVERDKYEKCMTYEESNQKCS